MTNNNDKLKLICHRIAFLMQHQHILPDLKDLANEISKDYPNDEYLKGATDALLLVINSLEERGPISSGHH
jgi:hypothetical protein